MNCSWRTRCFSALRRELCELRFPGCRAVAFTRGDARAATLDKHEGLRKLILKFAENNKPIAAICAAPMVLGKLGLLKGRRVTCYPSFEQYLEGAECTNESVVTDGNIITQWGRCGYGLCFGDSRKACR